MNTTKKLLMAVLFGAYLYLFYEQTPGLNFLIYSILLVLVTLILEPKSLKDGRKLLVASGVVLSAFGIALYGNTLSITANVLSLLALAGLNFHKEFSLVLAMIQTMFSYLFKPFSVLSEIGSIMMEENVDQNSWKTRIFTGANFLKVFFPLLILLIFLGLYSGSSQAFSVFLGKVLAQFSLGFILFAFSGLLVVYIFFNQYYFVELQKFDSSHGNTLRLYKQEEHTLFKTTLNEFDAAILTFFLLNLLLFTVNVVDFDYLLFGNKELVRHNLVVHEGINNSIVSVLVAIFVTLYFFRGNLNFISKNKSLKVLAIVWIVQNMILLGSCLIKNYDYIYAFGLTHKRIGVYVYLLIVFIGLLLTWYKIAKKKSNMFLVRSNSWSLFVLLSLSTPVNWNQFILDYNLKYHPKIHDKYYLEYLDISALSYLSAKWLNQNIDCQKEQKACKFQQKVIDRENQFLRDFEEKEWQSWTWQEFKTYQDLKSKSLTSKFQSYENLSNPNFVFLDGNCFIAVTK